MRTGTLVPCLVAGLCLGNLLPAYGGPQQVVPFDLNRVRLSDGPFQQAQQRDRKYLLSLDPDRLLHNFRVTAGLPSSARPLGGWEAPGCELRGHSVGHYLSACALMYAGTGDEPLQARAAGLVAELARCQAALPRQGYRPGFLAAYPESFFDRVDRCQPVWAPYYTLHKIMAGLLDVHLHCGNRQALDVLLKMANWLRFRVDRLSTEQMQRSLGVEHGGMNEVLANLYAVTRNPDHLRLARAFNHQATFAPLARGLDTLDGQHANTQIPKIIGAARQYELTEEQALHDVARFFWRQVALKRSYVIGGHSDYEHFFSVDRFAEHLSPATAETCNTYNMLKLTRHVFAWEPTAEVMDFYERALFNQILASQEPTRGMMIYFAPLKAGHFKTYNTPEDSFWCCTGTGMENHAKYGDTIYFHDENSLWVNLFIASRLEWPEKGLSLRQETRFPAEDTVRLTLKCREPLRLAIKIRCPAWAQRGAAVLVNGKPNDAPASPGSYLTLQRAWRDGDTLDVRLPMNLRSECLPGDPSQVAMLYGPIVLAGELGREGLEKVSPFARGQLDLSHVPAPPAPGLVTGAAELPAHVEPVAGSPLTFRTRGIGRPRDVTLIPYYLLHQQRYAIYWKLYTPQQWQARQAEIAAAEARRKALEARIVDQLMPGNPQSETDHKFRGERTNSGDFQARKWRDARGWFSWQLRVLPDAPVVLRCTYWGGDSGHGREFDLFVDGRKLAEQTIHLRPREFFDVEYPIPVELTGGKTSVTVKFQAHPGRMAGGVFDVLVLRAGPIAAGKAARDL
jgi:DUF1680 family protein